MTDKKKPDCNECKDDPRGILMLDNYVTCLACKKREDTRPDLSLDLPAIDPFAIVLKNRPSFNPFRGLGPFLTSPPRPPKQDKDRP